MFNSTFRDVYKTGFEACLSGFGKGYTPASIYVMHQFMLKDGKTEFRINNLFVAVTNYPGLYFDFILSNTMFSKTDNLIKNSEHILQITMPGDRPFICTPHISGKEIKRISVWAKQ